VWGLLILQQTRDFVLVCVGIAAMTVALGATVLHRSLGTEKPTLVTELQHGGLILVTLHAFTTTTATGGPDCRDQVSLSEQGRRQAFEINSGLRRLNIPVLSVLSSAACRARETATLAFPGPVTTSEALSSTGVSTAAVSADDVRDVQQLLSTPPPAGTNTALVTHSEIVAAAAGVTLSQGETAVFRPLGTHFTLLSRILPSKWKTLGSASHG
jgi:phosphohistidine phosphatase SixA